MANDDTLIRRSLRLKLNTLIQANGSDECAKDTFVKTIWPSVEADYKAMLDQLLSFCNIQLRENSVSSKIEGRVKGLRSIRASIKRRDEKRREVEKKQYKTLTEIFEDLHDLVGLRIVVENNSDVNKVSSFIQSTFMSKKKPTVFSSDRNVGKHWKPWFGAYSCTNHHVTVRPPTVETLAPYSDVMFEIQVTTLVDNLYNKVAHPLLYKGLVPTMNRREEIVVDLTHGVAVLYSLCLEYSKDLIQDANAPLPDMTSALTNEENIKDFLKSVPGASKALEQIKSTRGSSLIRLDEIKKIFQSQPKNCSTSEEVLAWVVEKLQPTAKGLHVVVEPPKPEIDIVFIHGFKGHHTQTWACEEKCKTDKRIIGNIQQTLGKAGDLREKVVFWPKHLLPEVWPNARVLTYGYHLDIQYRHGSPIGTSSTYDLAGDFLVALEAERRKRPDRPIIFVAHSLGGIIVKEMLLKSKNYQDQPRFQRVFKSTAGILFFGTLHNDMKRREFRLRIAELVHRVTGCTINDQIVNTLLPDSEQIKMLQTDFNSAAQARNWIIYSFQEEHGSMLGKKIVQDVSSSLNIPNETRQHMDRDHLNMTKFTSVDDSEFRKVTSALESISMSIAPKRTILRLGMKNSMKGVVTK